MRYDTIDTSHGEGSSVHGSDGSSHASVRCDEMPDNGRGFPGSVIPARGRTTSRVLDSTRSPSGVQPKPQPEKGTYAHVRELLHLFPDDYGIPKNGTVSRRLNILITLSLAGNEARSDIPTLKQVQSERRNSYANCLKNITRFSAEQSHLIQQ